MTVLFVHQSYKTSILRSSTRSNKVVYEELLLIDRTLKTLQTHKGTMSWWSKDSSSTGVWNSARQKWVSAGVPASNRTPMNNIVKGSHQSVWVALKRAVARKVLNLWNNSGKANKARESRLLAAFKRSECSGTEHLADGFWKPLKETKAIAFALDLLAVAAHLWVEWFLFVLCCS